MIIRDKQKDRQIHKSVNQSISHFNSKQKKYLINQREIISKYQIMLDSSFKFVLLIFLSLCIKYCQVCKYDEFYQGKGVCNKCDSSCVSCFGADKTDCFKCKGYKYQQMCLDICPAGYYEDNQTQNCAICNIPFCKQCIDKNKCEACEKGFQLSISKVECVFSVSNQSRYAYFNYTTNQIVEVEKCPDNLEQNEEQHICKYPKICSQDNYIGEFNSNCFNPDEGKITKKQINKKNILFILCKYKFFNDFSLQKIEGLKVYTLEYYQFFYTKKEVQQFSRGSLKFLFYLQNLNTDKDILNIIGIFNNLYVIYDKSIFVYSLGYNELIQTIDMPNIVLNTNCTKIISKDILEDDITLLITYSSSLQNIYVFDLMDMKNIKFQFEIGQNIIEFYVIPETNRLIIFTEFRVFTYSSFLEQNEPIDQQYIDELTQVDWIKCFSLIPTSQDQQILFILLNGLSIFIFNSNSYALTRVAAKSDYGYLLEQSNQIAFVYQNYLYFVGIKDLILNCSNEIDCLNQNKDLILFKTQIFSEEFYFVSEFNNHIYVSTKNSFQLSVYDRNFKLNSIFSDIQKPIKNTFFHNEQIQSEQQKSFLVISYDNNALILQPDQEPKQLFSFCNENNIEVQRIQEYGGVNIDQERHILINVAISMKGNLIILMSKNGQALFQKELKGDEIINGLKIIRQNFKILINSSSRLIKVFGLLNSQEQELILTIHYFNFHISPNYEVYFQVERIVSDQIFLAKESRESSSCLYFQLVNNQKSKLITCELQNFKEIKDNNKYIAISISDVQNKQSMIKIIEKDSLQLYKQIDIEIEEFNLEFLDTSNILIISSGKFAKFNLETIEQNQIDYTLNQITGRIFKYQIEQQKTWMIVQELKQKMFIFHFIDLLSTAVQQIDNKIIPLIALDDTNYVPYLSDLNCTFQVFPQSQYNEGNYFQIVASKYLGSDEMEIYSNSIMTYKVVSNSEIKLIDKKRIQQKDSVENHQLIEGPFSQNKLQFYNQLNSKEQISVLCSFQCQYTENIEKYQILYKNQKIPYIIKQIFSDRIFLDDYYQNTMYSDKWQILAIEAYQNADKQILANRRIDLFKYPEKQIIFSYSIKVLCEIFTYQMVGIYDTLIICDNMNILVYSLQEISSNYKKYSQGTNQQIFLFPDFIHSFQMDYPEKADQFAFFSQVDPQIILNLYGVYDFLENKFYEQRELLINDQNQQEKNYLLESKTHLYYTLNQNVYFYDKQKYKQQLNANFSQDLVNFSFNNKGGQLNLERDFIIEIHVSLSSEENIVFIYAFKNGQLYYINIDNDSLDFQTQQINLQQFDFQNFILICPGPKVQFALIDDNFNLIAQKSNLDTPCRAQLPQQFIGNVKGIQNLNLIIDQERVQLIFISTEQVLSVYNFQCGNLWQKNDIFNTVQAIIEDNHTQQIYIADSYFIYVIKYQDLLKKEQERNIIAAQFQLQARIQVKLQKLNDNLLAALSASKIHIFEVQKSFTLMLYIKNKDFVQIKQIFLIEQEYVVISDVNKLYIYKILADQTETQIKTLTKSGGSYSSYSSTSSNTHNYKSNQGDNSEYYSQKIINRKIAIPIYDQAYLSIQILKVETFTNEDSVFIRIIGADFNNLIDITRQIKFNSEWNSNYKVFESKQCVANYVIQKSQYQQLIQYDDIYSQNEGLYNQINFRFPSQIVEEEDNSDEDSLKSKQQNYLVIPNSLKFKTKMYSYFVYDLCNNNVYIPPSTIKSSVINKLKVMNGTLQQHNSEDNENNTSEIIQFVSLKYVHFENIELKKSLFFDDCDQVILENILINSEEQILIQFQNISTIYIKNLTIHQSFLSYQFIFVEASGFLNITQLNVYGDANNNSFKYPDQEEIENYGWISLISCQEVVIADVNFTNVNIAIDLFFLQDIDQLLLQNFSFLNLNLQFDFQENDSNKINEQPNSQINNQKIVNLTDSNYLDQYINLPTNSQLITCIFRIIYVKTQLKIMNIFLEKSNVSMLIHFNKTITIDYSANQKFSQLNESNKLQIQIFNITSYQLEQVQPYVCHFSDYIFIEAQNITIQDLNIYQAKCFQSIIRCQNANAVKIINSNIILADNINFLFYFSQNQNLTVENATIQQNNQLHHFFGIVQCQNSLLKNISVYPYVLKNYQQQQKIFISKIINTAILIYGKQDANNLVIIQDSLIQYLKSSSSNGTAIQIYQASLRFSNVKLSKNSAGLNGGAIYSKSSSITLSKTIIEYNNATFSGGAIFSINTTIQIIEENAINSTEKTLIQYNYAAIGGGIRYFKQTIDQVKGSFKNNKAIFFGQDYTNFPQRLMIVNSQNSNEVDDVVSSISYIQQEIQFFWLDEQNQKLNYLSKEIDLTNTKYQILQRELIQYSTLMMSSEKIQINRSKKELEIVGEIFRSNDGFQYILTKLSYLLRPKEQAEIKVRTMINFPGDEGKRQDQKEITITIQFRECISGEVFNSFDRQIYECLECKDNTFSLVKPSSFTQKCLMCPDIAKKCYKNVIEIKEGYWIEPNTTNIYYCFNNPNKCQPREINGCSQGGFGPRCESCDYQGEIWKGQGYTKYRDYECQECGDDQNLRLVLVSLFIVLFPFFFTYLAHQVTFEAEATLKAYYLKRAGIINLGLSIDDVSFSILAKFIINYIQIIQIVLYFNFRLPDILEVIIYFLGNPLQISQYFLDCFFIKNGWTNYIEIIYIRLLWLIINTLLYIIFSNIIAYFVAHLKYKKSYYTKDAIKRFVRNCMYYLYFMIFPSLLSQLITILSCEQIGTQKYVYSDNQFLCYSDQHLYIGFPIAAPLIFLLLVKFPIYILFELKANKNNFYKISFYLRQRFFFSEYKSQYYYWELVKIIQKGLLFLALSVYNESQITKGALLSVIMIIYIRKQHLSNPYKRLFLNQLDQAASFIQLICIQLGMIYITTDDEDIQKLMFASFILLNTLFFIFFIIALFKEKFSYNKDMLIYPCIQRIIQKIPFTQKYLHTPRNAYMSHKGWKKVQMTVRKIGYQTLALYFIDSKMVQFSKNIFKRDKNSSQTPPFVQSVKQIKPQQNNEIINLQNSKSKCSKKSLFYETQSKEDIKNITSLIISSDQQLQSINSVKLSKPIKIPNEDCLPSEMMLDKKLNSEQTIQKLPETKNFKCMKTNINSM
ncbi:transmembrane protein, putative (macronuclear) [Tetrahymena thermophila SB210]|uniref:Transmembrane protein, putative n=1 Tax=Tetrahymena thermophila (strain SB210) TaxID=312017 RepID=Q22RK6_TETTS|nr:transmembrane protein, putative [Tetrahymena thermophila SB210]EAR88116.2 transmembrane protein, putative [Tetrahymena thermophila SB210]|eukprot:XP_001008361.2 transmembrane protein, putative [Tetrahymena thermophila SB210]